MKAGGRHAAAVVALAIAGAAGAVAGGCERGPPRGELAAPTPTPTPTQGGPFIALERDFQGFRSWRRIDLPPRGPQGITHVAGRRREYARLPVSGGGAPTGAFPVGTMFVKEVIDGAEAGHQLFGMVKRGGGYNARGAPGWEWFELRERQKGEGDEGSVGIVWRGINAPAGESYGGDPLGGCNSCHELAAANDFVRSPVVQVAAAVPAR